MPKQTCQCCHGEYNVYKGNKVELIIKTDYATRTNHKLGFICEGCIVMIENKLLQIAQGYCE